ncbi:hypothetical protein BGZ63DRAFT_407082 [Mariannaea sp. PMI_226]|nr:hypothetical protein BGZ63DRAFT_407082 [Mariannaea sp. PMI_226]
MMVVPSETISSFYFRKTVALLPPEAHLETTPNPKTPELYPASPADYRILAKTLGSKKSELPVLLEHAKDDSDINSGEWRHVDYLSHDWKEDDIRLSWKYIMTRRREYPNRSRLENTSWRIWTKCKYKLKTICPESLNWFKDYDLTWLYGPFQQDPGQIYCADTKLSGNSSSKSNSHVSVSNKPILKRTSPGIMLQRPLSHFFLLKQTMPPLARGQETESRRSTRLSLGSASSGISLGVERKHIRFNDKVEQFIAVEGKSDVDDGANYDSYSERDSGDGCTMRRRRPPKRASSIRRKLTNDNKSFPSDERTIAMLPSTRLNHGGPVQDPSQDAMKHIISIRNPIPTPSLSQETCPKHLGRFLEEEENYDMTDVDIDEDSVRGCAKGFGELPSKDMIFGCYFNTVDTARDMAYFLWNMGRRKRVS